MKNYLALILALSFLLRLALAVQPVDVLVQKAVLDDSFYYFSEAKGFIYGNGITSNGHDPTNGLHPLWLFVIAPAFLGSNLDLSVNLVLLLATLLDLISIALIYKIARKFLSENFSLFAAALYGFNFFIIAQTLSGLDVALAVPLLLAIFLEFYGKKRPIHLGVLVGLLVLSRLDGVFLAAIILFHLLYEKNISAAKKFFFVSAAIVLPWFIWSFVNFGTIQQSTAEAVFLHRHGVYDGPYTIPQSLNFIWNNFIRSAGTLLHQLGFYSGANLIVKIFVSLAALAGIATMVRSWKKFNLIIIFGAALVLFYSSYMWATHIRYFTPLMPFLIISLIAFFEKGIFSKILRPDYILPLVLLAVIMINGYLQWQDGYYQWAAPAVENLKWVEENTSSSNILGSFNSGLLSYYSNRLAINLDGLLNFDAIEALKNKNVGAYMKSKNITYWIDGSFVDKSVYDEIRAGRKFDVIKENIYSQVLGDGANFTIVKEDWSLVKHITGREMGVVVFVAKVN